MYRSKLAAGLMLSCSILLIVSLILIHIDTLVIARSGVVVYTLAIAIIIGLIIYGLIKNVVKFFYKSSNKKIT